MGIVIKKVFAALLPVFLLTVFFTGLPALGQLKKDKKAEQYFSEGVKKLNAKDYAAAAKSFQNVAQRDFNRVTTAAIYMAGLAYFYQDDYERSISKFQYLINTYPKSQYVDDATYHKALLMIDSPENRMGGLYLLTKLHREARTKEMRQDAINAFKYFLYVSASSSFLKEYYGFAKTEYTAMVLEALCYRLYEERKFDELTEYLRSYEKAAGELSYRLKSFEIKKQAREIEADVIDVALVLPFQAHKQYPELTSISLWSAEMLAGMQVALDMKKDMTPVGVRLKVFDSEKSDQRLNELIASDLNAFSPDFVIGEILNKPSKELADFSESKKAAQFIPLSPVESLVQKKKHVFLANPSMRTQISGLANYAIKELELEKIMVVTESSNLSRIQADFFCEAVAQNKLSCVERTVAEDYQTEGNIISFIIQDLKARDFDAVFLATSDETLISYFTNSMKRNNAEVQLLGVSNWGQLELADARILSDFNTIFVDSYYPNNDILNKSKFEKAYEKRFNKPPSEYSFRGYDLISYILYCSGNKPEQSDYTKAIRDAAPYRGLVQNYFYRKANDNQSVQLLQYQEGIIEKIKPWE